jgi:hypothetical protein
MLATDRMNRSNTGYPMDGSCRYLRSAASDGGMGDLGHLSPYLAYPKSVIQTPR